MACKGEYLLWAVHTVNILQFSLWHIHTKCLKHDFIGIYSSSWLCFHSNPFKSVRIRSNPFESFPLSASEDILDLDIGPDRESGYLLTSLRQENLSQRSKIRAGHASFFCVTASSGKNYQLKKLSAISRSPHPLILTPERGPPRRYLFHWRDCPAGDAMTRKKFCAPSTVKHFTHTVTNLTVCTRIILKYFWIVIKIPNLC